MAFQHHTLHKQLAPIHQCRITQPGLRLRNRRPGVPSCSVLSSAPQASILLVLCTGLTVMSLGVGSALGYRYYLKQGELVQSVAPAGQMASVTLNNGLLPRALVQTNLGLLCPEQWREPEQKRSPDARSAGQCDALPVRCPASLHRAVVAAGPPFPSRPIRQDHTHAKPS